jgi:hypothetical protein
VLALQQGVKRFAGVDEVRNFFPDERHEGNSL